MEQLSQQTEYDNSQKLKNVFHINLFDEPRHVARISSGHDVHFFRRNPGIIVINQTFRSDIPIPVRLISQETSAF